MKSTAESRRDASVDLIAHSSVQPWSAGDIFPAVINRVDYHPPEGGEAYASRWALTLDGRREEGYASHDAAAEMARALLADPDLRRDWAAGEI